MNNTEALRAAAQQALAAMEKYPVTVNHWKAVLLPAADALRAALAQPAASGEPADPMLACEIQPRPLSNPLTDYHCAGVNGTPLHYTWTDKPHRLLYDLIAAVRFYAQPAPARVPLTDEQISNMWAHECVRERLTRDLVQAFARAIEAAHGITAPGAPDAGPVQ